MLGTGKQGVIRMTVPAGPDRNSNEQAQARGDAAPFDLVPGLAEDFAAAGALFVATCGGNTVLRLLGQGPGGLSGSPRET
jgi:hypothetical protein